jgi:MFS family permease
VTSYATDATVTAPLPTLAERPKWRDTFSALKVYNYRLYVIAQLFANTTGWMQRIATDWLVLQLTGSLALVGLTVALQCLPILLFGIYGGVLADRWPKRLTILRTQCAVALLSGLLAVLAITGAVHLWHVYAIVFTIGMLQVVENPARSVFVNELVGHSRLRNAISVNASIFHLGGLLGPAIAGGMIVLVGAGWAIGINAAAGLITISALLLMRTAELRVAPRVPPARGQIREAVRYVLAKPTIAWPMAMLFFVSVFGMSLPALLAGMANSVLHTGAQGYGLYNSLAAVGALSGALLSTRRASLRLRSVILAGLAYGLFTLAAGLAPAVWIFMAMLIGIGVSRLLFATAGESLSQLTSNVAIRGRVMSIYMMILIGGQSIGGPLMGFLADTLGPQAALTIAGAVPALAATVLGIVLARKGRLSLKVSLERGSLVRIVDRSQRGRADVAARGRALAFRNRRIGQARRFWRAALRQAQDTALRQAQDTAQPARLSALTALVRSGSAAVLLRRRKQQASAAPRSGA